MHGGSKRERIAGSRDGVGRGKQKFTLFLHNWKDKVSICISITALTVARNDLPRIMGTQELSSISMIMKSYEMTY